MATVSYKCPNCGAGLQFDPGLQKSKCEYCKSVFTNAQLEEINGATDEKDGKRISTEQESGHSHFKGYVCNNCGAEVVTEETTSATLCYYCHNPVLLTDRLAGELKPDKIIPFTYDKGKAVDSFLSWAKSKKFVPKEFYDVLQLKKITGLYIPYWIADVKADVDVSGSAADIRVWKSGDTEYTEHREYRIQRQGEIKVNNIPEIAVKNNNKGLLESIASYDISKAVDFSMSYLSGFFAEKYDIPKEGVQPGIEERVTEYASTLVNETIRSYGRLSIERNTTDISVEAWHYTLLPVWMLTYIFNGKTYIYAVNGQTGESYGELPLDRKKLGIVSGMIAAIIFAFTVYGGFAIW